MAVCGDVVAEAGEGPEVCIVFLLHYIVSLSLFCVFDVKLMPWMLCISFEKV